LGTKLTSKDINTKAVTDKYNAELDFGYQMIVRGTPTLYINNDFDNNLAKTQEIMKELGK
jgi:protein-disulfide isomerase